MAEELESLSLAKNGDREKNSNYVNQLQKMNDLQAKEIIILSENLEKNEKKHRKDVETL